MLSHKNSAKIGGTTKKGKEIMKKFLEERTKRKKAETKLERQKQREKQLQEETKEIRKKYNVLKEKVFQEKQQNEALQAMVAALQQENQRLQEEKKEWLFQQNEQHKEQHSERQKKWAQEKQRLLKKNEQLVANKKQQQVFIGVLQRKIKLLEAIKNAEKPKKNEEKLRSIQRELHFYKQKVIEIEQTFSAQHYVEKLYENLTIDTVDQYLMEGKNPFGPLGAEVSKVLKKRIEWEGKQETLQKTEHQALLGYIGKTKRRNRNVSKSKKGKHRENLINIDKYTQINFNNCNFENITADSIVSSKNGRSARAVSAGTFPVRGLSRVSLYCMMYLEDTS